MEREGPAHAWILVRIEQVSLLIAAPVHDGLGLHVEPVAGLALLDGADPGVAHGAHGSDICHKHSRHLKPPGGGMTTGIPPLSGVTTSRPRHRLYDDPGRAICPPARS